MRYRQICIPRKHNKDMQSLLPRNTNFTLHNALSQKNTKVSDCSIGMYRFDFYNITIIGAFAHGGVNVPSFTMLS